MWHVTRDTWQMTRSVGLTFSQNFGSLAFRVWDWQCLEDISTNHYLAYWINDGGNCRTAPATQGLFKIIQDLKFSQYICTLKVLTKNVYSILLKWFLNENDARKQTHRQISKHIDSIGKQLHTNKKQENQRRRKSFWKIELFHEFLNIQINLGG